LGVRGDAPTTGTAVTAALDRSMLHVLGRLVEETTVAFDGYDYARALERTERFFWSFCDDYVELVKQRAYGSAGDDGATSARGALGFALSTILRLFAPHLPFVTEEVWSWWQDGSIHRADWPDAAALRDAAGDPAPLVYDVAGQVLGEIRKAKTSQQKSLRAEVERAVVRDASERLEALHVAVDDVREAGRVRALETAEAGKFAVEVELAESDAA
jgi:valyl-tRNA synthetase